jgi:hypothetical protein
MLKRNFKSEKNCSCKTKLQEKNQCLPSLLFFNSWVIYVNQIDWFYIISRKAHIATCPRQLKVLLTTILIYFGHQNSCNMNFFTSALMILTNLFCDCAFIIYFVLCKVGFIIAKIAINTFVLHN